MKALVLSTNNYRSFPSRKQRFARRLAQRGYDVLYVEAPVTWLAAARPQQWQKLRAWRSGPRDQEGHLWTVSPTPWFPFFKKHERIADMDARRYTRFLRRLPGDWTSDIGIVLTYLPFIPEALRLLKAPAVYDCVDDHSAYPGLIDKGTVDHLEQRTAEFAGAVIATNETIGSKFATFEEKLSIIPNGVDHDLFAKPALAWLDTISELPHGRRFLYVGAMREWFDTDTVRALSDAFPDASIDCYGSAFPDVQKQLSSCSNVVFKGTLPQAKIAEIAGAYDLALIPFRDSPLTAGVDPLKFYEYASAGLPVVASMIQALGAYPDTSVALAGTPDEFVKAARSMLAADSIELRRARIASSQQFDWSYRLAEFDRVLESLPVQHS